MAYTNILIKHAESVSVSLFSLDYDTSKCTTEKVNSKSSIDFISSYCQLMEGTIEGARLLLVGLT